MGGSTGRIITRYLEEEMRDSYISYAMSVIVGRALPDAKDGLKPVQRRILYTMHQLNLHHRAPFKKCARIVGECLGKFHPHGDVAVYDALVRMAQDFSLRYPLVEGQGNFGSLDADPPAAMRYTEARLAAISDFMLQDIEKQTVDFVFNFDNSLKEPTLLPAAIPNLLINGSSGIAVGMATNIPPHNLSEVADAISYLIDNPAAEIKELTKIVKGPDFPGGGIICGKKDILDMYTRGRGHITLRGRAFIEHHKNKEAIVITELPYQVNKASLLESIANLVKLKKIEGISDLRDESDKEGLRIVLDLRKEAQAQVILNQLYKHTNLEVTFGAIMLALVNNKPEIFNLKQLLQIHIGFRKEIIVKRSKFELEKAKRRAHILEGLKVAIKFLDEVIKIIRKAKSPSLAKETLMKRLKLTDIQAQSILELQLQRLTALEREKLEKEYLDLIKKIEYLNSILASEKKQELLIKEELAQIKNKFGDKRRTEITGQKQDLDVEDLISEEDMVIAITHGGYIKRQPLSVYRRQGRGGRGVTAIATKEEDFVEHLFISSSKDQLLLFTNNGKAYTLKTYEIPLGSRTARGRAVANLLHLASGERLKAVLSIKEFLPEHFVIMATEQGYIKKVSLKLFSNLRKSGIIAIRLAKKDTLIGVSLSESNDDEVILSTKGGKAIRFRIGKIRSMGRQARGIRGIRLNRGDKVLNMVLASAAMLRQKRFYLLGVSEKGFAKRTLFNDYRLQARGGRGTIAAKLSARTGQIAATLLVLEEDEVICITQKGILIRSQVNSVRPSGRNTQGVRFIRLDSDDRVASAARVIKEGES